jgi:hypothetical protein
MTFKLAGARSQVCKYCKFLVARSDRGLSALGRVADLAELPSPLSVGVTGRWNGQRFEVEGRLQLDRVGAASAPWQEFYVVLVETGEGYWVAHAQGRWYATRAVQPLPELPPLGALGPGRVFPIGQVGNVAIAEVGRRRVLTAEGELPNVPPIGAIAPYADFSGANGLFGTIDYGDGQTVGPCLYAGSAFDPATFQLDSGQPLERPEAKVEACTCPGCGGSLPLVAPGTTERIVCRYCGVVSDVAQGALKAIGQAPRPRTEPYIPIGQEGNLRGKPVVCIGFVERGTVVEGVAYAWREYLLYAGPSLGYLWLMEEDLKWQLVSPLSLGDIERAGTTVHLRGNSYEFKQAVKAYVEYVVGEFYWKIAVGESVTATEYAGPGGNVSLEQDGSEVNASFCEPIEPSELASAFNIAPPPSPSKLQTEWGTDPGGLAVGCFWIVALVLFVLFVGAVADCEGGDDDDGGGVYVGPSYSGK